MYVNFIYSWLKKRKKREKLHHILIQYIKKHKTNSLEPTTNESHSNTAQGLTHAPTISHEDEKTALILFLTGGFTVWFLLR